MYIYSYEYLLQDLGTITMTFDLVESEIKKYNIKTSKFGKSD